MPKPPFAETAETLPKLLRLLAETCFGLMPKGETSYIVPKRRNAETAKPVKIAKLLKHAETSIIGFSKNRGGRPPNSIWEDINKGEAVGSGKFAASCKYCKNTWSRGEVSKLEEHLSNHCPDAPAAVVRRYMTKVMERQDKSKSSKKRKYSEGQSNMDDYHDSTELNEQRCTRINRALVKFFIACGIAFRVVEHPFFINFIKELNAAQVNFKVNSELEKETNLTLAFDGWTSGTHRSI
ncbi:unnamed protein product [Rhizophagus irregularis]|nr:unnamed protein product [Rhizophagus irregularis]